MACVTAFFLGTREYETSLALVALLLQPVAILSCLGGTKLANDVASGQYGLSSFIGTRPLPTVDLVSAKLKVAALLTLSMWLVTLGCLGAWAVATGDPPNALRPWLELYRDHPAYFIVATTNLAAAWSLLVGGLPLWLTGRMPGFPWSLLVWLVAVIALGTAVLWFYKRPDLQDFAQILLSLAVTVKILLAFWGFRRACRLSLLPLSQLTRWLAFWSLATLLFAIVLVLACRTSGLPTPFVLLSAILFVPLARLPLSILALNWNRHR
jgi:hypothetical protein